MLMRLNSPAGRISTNRKRYGGNNGAQEKKTHLFTFQNVWLLTDPVLNSEARDLLCVNQNKPLQTDGYVVHLGLLRNIIAKQGTRPQAGNLTICQRIKLI